MTRFNVCESYGSCVVVVVLDPKDKELEIYYKLGR
jgi:hypothetical protein